MIDWRLLTLLLNVSHDFICLCAVPGAGAHAAEPAARPGAAAVRRTAGQVTLDVWSSRSDIMPELNGLYFVASMAAVL